jgi:hypothetical protein
MTTFQDLSALLSVITNPETLQAKITELQQHEHNFEQTIRKSQEVERNIQTERQANQAILEAILAHQETSIHDLETRERQLDQFDNDLLAREQVLLEKEHNLNRQAKELTNFESRLIGLSQSLHIQEQNIILRDKAVSDQESKQKQLKEALRKLIDEFFSNP